MIAKGKSEDADALVSWIEDGVVDVLKKGLLRL
jgi:hypothetical protein